MTKITLSREAEVKVAHDVAVGARVLELEATGLTALAASLDQRFSDAVSAIAEIRGRVVVSGMGKSGHIARKIAATLASTGTPAMFVHPADASHGDLGMITEDDCLLLISNSGETKELADIVGYAKRYSIPVVAICGRAESTLAETAYATLLLPDIAEACPIGDAPTTSTTVSLALGDALAVALLERKGFTLDQFKIFHPGGTLGQALIWVENIMRVGEELALIEPDASMSEAILKMTATTFGRVGVIDEFGRLIAAVTDGDIRRHMSPTLLECKVSEVMSLDPKTIGPHALASEAVRLMNEFKITNLYVVDPDSKPVGMLRMHDCLGAGVV